MSCNFMVLSVQKFKNFDVIGLISIFEPRSRAVQPLLWSFLPISSKKFAINPNIPFSILTQIEKGISSFLQLKGAVSHNWKGDGRWWAIPKFHTIVDRYFWYTPFEFIVDNCFIFWGFYLYEFYQTFSIVFLHFAVVYMPHSLDQDFHIAFSSWTFDWQKLIGYFLSWQRALQDTVDIDKSKISESNIEEMIALTLNTRLIENKTLIVHLQQITLEIRELCILECLFG